MTPAAWRAGGRHGPAIFVALGALLYAPSLGAGYFGDDLCYLIDPDRQPLLGYFTTKCPYHAWLRPLESVVLHLSQRLAGTAAWPHHLVAIGCHLWLCLLVRGVAEALGWSARGAWLAAALMLACQTNAIAVAGNDCLSQVFAVLFGCLALWWLYRSVQPSEARPGRWYLASVAALALALLGKETGLSVVVAGACLVVACRRRTVSPLALLARLAGWAAVAAVYLPYRSAVVGLAMQHTGPYGVQFSSNLLTNAALLVGAPLVAWPTIDLGLALQRSDASRLLAAAAATAVVLVPLVAASRRAPAPRVRLTLLVLAVASVSAVLPLGHISELHVYAALPFCSLLVGAAADQWLAEAQGRTRRWRIAVLAAWAAMHLVVLQVKLHMMADNGRRAAALLPAAAEAARDVAPNGTLWMVAEPDEPVYSVYRLPGFHVLRLGTVRIEVLAGREDIEAVVVDRPALRPRPGDVVLELRDGRPERAQEAGRL